MTLKRATAFVVVVLLCSASVMAALSAFTLQVPVIRHDAVEYIPNNRFPRIDAVVVTAAPIRSVKLYFRAAASDAFYFVEMHEDTEQDSDELRLSAVLPIPERETASVVYYIEVTGTDSRTYRSPEYSAATTSEPVLAVFQGEEPEIELGKTVESGPDVPPGFQSVGIVSVMGIAGTATVLGAAGGAGAAIGLGTAVAIGGAAAAGAAVGVAAIGETPLNACFTGEPSSFSITSGESIRLDARCSEPMGSIDSYAWDLGDGRSRTEPFINPIFPAPGRARLTQPASFTITLTVMRGGESQSMAQVLHVMPSEVPPAPEAMPAGLMACFTTDPSPANIVTGQRLRLDARCTSPRRDSAVYRWDLGDGRVREGVFVQPAYTQPGLFIVTLTVEDASGRDSVTQPVTVEGAATSGPSGVSRGIDLPRWPSSEFGVAISNVLINGLPTTGPFPPGATVSISLSYNAYHNSCPGCVAWIQVGWAHLGNPQQCIYGPAVPGPAPGDSGNAGFSVQVPSTPGTYFLGFGFPLTFNCPVGWWNGAPGMNQARLFAQIVVQ